MTGVKNNSVTSGRSRFRFSLAFLLTLTTVVAIAIVIWPRPTKPGYPNLSGRIIDKNGKAIPNVVVKTYGGIATRLPGQQTTTNKHGRYRFEPIRTGMPLEAEGSGLLKVGIQLEHPTHCLENGKSWSEEEFAMVEGFENVRNFILTPGGTLSGVLLSDLEQPIPDLSLRIISKPGQYVRYAQTDAAGRFEETALPPGEYDIEINGGDYAKVGRAVVVESQNKHLELRYVNSVKQASPE